MLAADSRFRVKGHQHFCRHLRSFIRRFVKFSRHERPCGSRPAFAWDHVAPAVAVAQSLSVSLLVGLRFFHIPIPAPHSADLAARLPARAGENRVYPVPCRYPCRVDLAFPPVVHHLRWVIADHPTLTTCLLAQACEPALVNSFGLLNVTAFISDSHVLVLLHHPGSRPHGISSRKIMLAHFPATPFGVRLRCPRSFRPRRYQRRLCK